MFLRLKITGYTSTEVKRNYNEKTYKRWYADLRKEVYSKIEKKKRNRLESSRVLKNACKRKIRKFVKADKRSLFILKFIKNGCVTKVSNLCKLCFAQGRKFVKNKKDFIK